MTARLVHIWRHPIKGIGCEALTSADLTAGAPLPNDRTWALLHAGAEDIDGWQPRRNYLVVANGPRLAQITAALAPPDKIDLGHPDLPPLRFSPATEGHRLIDWIRPLWPDSFDPPHRLVRAPAQGMGDNGAAQVSLMNLASLRALSQHTGQPLDPRRFRGNLWLDGLAPWEEFDLLGKPLRIGQIQLQVTDRIQRCRATEANPETGLRDVMPTKALHEGWGHMDFGVYATVTSGGPVAIDDKVTR